jgi:hypothetical protein
METRSDRRRRAAGGRRLLAPGLAAAAVALVLVCVYVRTLAPGLLMNDSGEFQTLAATLGHTHPTGYPVYLLLGKLATFIPAGDVAWRVNLVSAISAGVAAAELVLLGYLLSGRIWLPAAAALALGLSPTLWSQAIIAEVYAPAAALMLGVLLCLAVWQKTQQTRWLAAAAVIGGLSIGVHLSVALMAPAALVFVALDRTAPKRNFTAAALGGLGGLLLTLAAFGIVDAGRPPSDYFEAVVNPSRPAWGLGQRDLDGFAERLRFSLSARQYGQNLRRPTAAALKRQAGEYFSNLPEELPPLWLLAAAIGFVQLLRGNRRYAVLLVLTLGTHMLYVIHHDMGDIHVAYIPTYVVLAVFGTTVLGVRSVVEPAKRWTGIAEAVLVPVLLGATFLPMFENGAWTLEGRRAAWVPEGEPRFEVGYSERLQRDLTATVNALEEDATVFTEWALIYPFCYVAHVEQGRTTMRFIQTYPAIGQDRLADSALELIAEESAVRPVYLSDPLPEVAQSFELQPVSKGGMLLFRVGARRGL